MTDDDIARYCACICEDEFSQAIQIDPATVVTAPWVRFKCQFGCPLYDRSYCCPPHTPTPEQTSSIIDSYNRAILIRYEAHDSMDRGKLIRDHYDALTTLEGELFKDGYYKALLFLSGPCTICKECALSAKEPCTFRSKARPSMEACGVDVYQTVRNNGFTLETLSDKTDTQIHFCLMLVD